MKERATWIRPVDLKRLLEAVLFALEGESVVVLEGELNSLALPRELECTLPTEFRSEAPGSQAVALRLKKGDAVAVLDTITTSEEWTRNIEALQVFTRGQRAFLSGDAFDEQCISIWPAAPPDLVEMVISKNLARRL